MHRLVRSVRFSINPFLAEDVEGSNSFASKPAGQGLAVFFELAVGLVGEVEPTTGFVLNIVDIDKNVRKFVVPIFAEHIRKNFRQNRHIGFGEIAELLKSSTEQLAGTFGKAMPADLTLKLNPFRKVAIDCEDYKMIYLSEKFEFAATHKLWNDEFSEQKNVEVFGKCANPAGHGHNYTVEVTIKFEIRNSKFKIGDFEEIVDEQMIKLLDHKNLNADVAYFAGTNPTVENLAVFAWEKLAGKFNNSKLHSVTVWETDKTCCTYYG